MLCHVNPRSSSWHRKVGLVTGLRWRSVTARQVVSRHRHHQGHRSSHSEACHRSTPHPRNATQLVIVTVSRLGALYLLNHVWFCGQLTLHLSHMANAWLQNNSWQAVLPVLVLLKQIIKSGPHFGYCILVICILVIGQVVVKWQLMMILSVWQPVGWISLQTIYTQQ